MSRTPLPPCLAILTLAGCQPAGDPAVPGCAGCRIEVTPVLTFGQDDPRDYLPADPYAVVQDSRGRYIVAVPDHGGDRLWVFDDRGRFVRSFAPRGEGPGEMLSVRVLALVRGDTLHAYDDVRGQRLVFDPDHHFIRLDPAPRNLQAALPLVDGNQVLTGLDSRGDKYARPYLLSDHAGELTSIFGDSILINPRDPVRQVRRLGPAAAPNEFWSAPWAYRYRIERWTAAGALAQAFELQSEDFTPYDTILGPTPDRPPQATLYAVWEGSDGVLWTSLMVSDPGWRRGLGPQRRIEGQEVWPTEDPDRVYDGMLEAFDAVTGARLASLRVPQPFHFRLSEDLVAGVRWDRDGLPSIEVARVRLVRLTP